MPKIELDIIVEHKKDGRAMPKTIVWDDGRKFNIDKILDIRRAAATKCGGVGIRYICRIRNKEIRLFDEEGKWSFPKLKIPHHKPTLTHYLP